MTAPETYLDDRLFRLAVVPAALKKDKSGAHQTILFYEDQPEGAFWAVATFRNVAGLPLVGVNHFETREQAQAYRDAVEPSVPLASLGGQSPNPPLSQADYALLKTERGFAELDPGTDFAGQDRKAEAVVQTEEQFVAGLQAVASVFRG